VPIDDLRCDDQPAMIAADVRTLAGDVHRVLSRAAAGEQACHDKVLVGLQRRASDLLDRMGEGRIGEGPQGGLRRWVQVLQRRIFVLQWLGGCLADRLDGGRRSSLRLSA
jgi:hypothetical protein